MYDLKKSHKMVLNKNPGKLGAEILQLLGAKMRQLGASLL